MTENDVVDYLNGKIRNTIKYFLDLFSEIEQASTSKKTFKKYIIGKDKYLKSYAADDRRLYYVHNKFIESISFLNQSLDNPNPLILQALADRIPVGADSRLYLKEQLSIIEKKITSVYLDFNIIRAKSYNQGDIIRRIIENLELAPLKITYLDPELFSLCYVISVEKDILNTKECELILARIQQEFHEYIAKQKTYHDLSTLWWALRILIYQDYSIPIDKKYKFISDFLTLEPIRYITINHQSINDATLRTKLLTSEGEKYRSFEVNPDFVTEMRSINYCHQNASIVKQWIIEKRDPRQRSLINLIREFEDACSSIGLRWCKSTTDMKWLYDTCLKLDFLDRYWNFRVSEFSEALTIINGTKVITDESHIDDYVTSNKQFSADMDSILKSIDQYLNNPNKEHPLVIGLFGNPGAGKTHLAKKMISKFSKSVSKHSKINLSNIYDHAEFYTKLRSFYDLIGDPIKIVSLLIDEFDVRINNDFCFRWLLTLLWDLEIPDKETLNLFYQIGQ